MSTDIFQNKSTVDRGPNPFAILSPLQFYLAASLPLTLITLLIWAAFHWWQKRQDHLRKFRSYLERHGMLLA